MNCYNDYSENRISVDEFVEILKVIENYIIRRFICNISANTLNKIFPVLYQQIKNRDSESIVNGLKIALQTRGYPKDAEFKLRLMDAKLYGSGDRAIKSKLILEALEIAYNHKEQISFEKLTIEHVMPQTPTEYWQNHLGDDWEANHELLVHTIGNLTLTAYNPELSNDPFEKKKERLINSHLEINRYFSVNISWNKEDIEKRASYLADQALTVWPYFGNETTWINEPAKVTGTTPRAAWILGQYFKVKNWRDVLEQTLNTIAELEPQKFEQIIHQFPRHIGRDKRKFRSIRELKNGTFIEVSLSAQDIQKLCFQVLETVELEANDLKVEVI